MSETSHAKSERSIQSIMRTCQNDPVAILKELTLTKKGMT